MVGLPYVTCRRGAVGMARMTLDRARQRVDEKVHKEMKDSALTKTLPNFCQNVCKFRSFLDVSAPIFASRYAFCSIFQNLPDYLVEIFEI